ncbi:hypothetical protein EBU99_08940 [bacterium]|nr:hypothetical protein [bacterium]
MFSAEISNNALLETFERWTDDFPSIIPWCVELGSSHSQFTVVIGTAIHGNETGSLPAVLNMIADLSEDNANLKARYFFILGNPDAVRQGTRFVERDLNRCFNLTDTKSLEGKRAIEIAKVLSEADLFIDYHQTNQPAVFPFFTFAYHEESYCWAAHMGGGEHFVTRDIKTAFSKEGLCGDEWLRQHGKPAVTLELGRAGLSRDAYQVTLSSLQRVIGFVETELEHGQKPQPSAPDSSRDLRFYQVVAKLPWPGDEAMLNPGFANFQYVKANEELGVVRPGEILRAPVEGFLMFPKYPKRDAQGKPIDHQDGDIVQIVQPLNEHPRRLWNH